MLHRHPTPHPANPITPVRISLPARAAGLLGLALGLLALAAPPAAAQQRPSLAQLEDEVRREAASLAKLTQVMVDMIFSFSELGYQEEWTS